MKTTQIRCKGLPRVAALLLVVVLGGCVSQRPTEHGIDVPVDAIAYYLPRQLIDIEVERAPLAEPSGAMEDRFTLRLHSPVPDPRIPLYVLPNWTRHTVGTTEAGLLTSVNAPSRDPVAQLLGKFAVAKPEGPRTAVQPGTCRSIDGLSVAPSTEARPFTTTLIVDPTVPPDLARAEGQLCSMGAHYRFVLTQLGKSLVIKGDTPSYKSRKSRTFEYWGLVYRRPEPYLFTVYKEEEGTEAVQFVGALQVLLPNLAPLESTTKEGVAFRDGMLVAQTASPKPRGFEIHFEGGKKAEPSSAQADSKVQ